ncbi:MAG: OB-fold nucleic acid binding domain-containing protein [Propionibacteriaceae bacterium]
MNDRYERGTPGGVFGRVWRRLTSSNAELEAAALQREVAETGAVSIKSCEDRDKVILSGALSDVTINPCGDAPALEAQLTDGSGTVTLIWLGRQEIPGIEPGRTVRIVGRISCRADRRVIYNPGYELLPDPS